jgi:hypothetical protein
MTIAFGQDVKALNLFRGPSQQDVKRWAGVNLAGLEFGMQTTGTMNQDPMEPPPISQIQHFRAEHVTAFRIPISWQRMQVSRFLSLCFFLQEKKKIMSS